MKNKNVLNNNRIEWIDVAKAIAIILVGVGHYKPSRGLCIWIYSFHMPLFFMLSGITINIKKYSFGNYIRRKAKSFLLPWVVFATLDAILQSIYRRLGISSSDYNIFDIPGKIIINKRIGEWDPIYWFLPCLFLAEVLIYFLVKFLGDDNKKILTVIVVLCIAAGLYEKMVGKILPWEIDLMPIVVSFILIGHLYGKNCMIIVDLWKNSKKIIISVLCIVIGSALGFYNANVSGYPVDICWGRYGNIVLMITGAVFISFGIVLASYFVHIRIINFIGKNSLWFYLLQPSCYKIVDIALILISSLLPFYSYKYGASISSLMLLHLCVNVLIIIIICVFKDVFIKKLIELKAKKTA